MLPVILSKRCYSPVHKIFVILQAKFEPIQPIQPVEFTVTVNGGCAAANLLESFEVTVGDKVIKYTGNEFQHPCRDMSIIMTVKSFQSLNFKLALKNGTTYDGGGIGMSKDNSRKPKIRYVTSSDSS